MCTASLVPRPHLQNGFRHTITDESLQRWISLAVQELRYEKATHEQHEAMKNFALGRDMFVSLPTGSGKSLCYAALPLVFDNIRKVSAEQPEDASIVVCVSPLSALMLDQVMTLSKRGLLAAHVGVPQKYVEVKNDVEQGKY